MKALAAALAFLVLTGISLAQNTAEAEAAYTRTITQRSTTIVEALAVADTAQSNRVLNVLINQYRTLNAWHSTNDATLKALKKKNDDAAKTEAAKVRATLKPIHDQFLQDLAAAGMSPTQIETVKDRMTYGKLKVTYDAYCEIMPNLTDAQKVRIKELLTEAREEAMDGGSADEKSDIFNRYKGKINNYLTAEGHNVGQAFKDWNARKKATAPAAK